MDKNLDKAVDLVLTAAGHGEKMVNDLKHAAKHLREAAKPAAVDLGEWRGWELIWNADFRPEYLNDVVTVDGKAGYPRVWWKPGLDLASIKHYPEMANALLTAYHRAVKKCNAPLPEGWEWLMDEMPDDWTAYAYHVWLGNDKAVGGHGFVLCWPISDMATYRAEATRRAAMLGLCEAKPAPDERDLHEAYPPDAKPTSAEEQLRQAGATVYTRIKPTTSTPFATIDTLGHIGVHANNLTLPRAVAALRASRGEHLAPPWVDDERDEMQKVNDDLRQQLAARDEEIKRLQRELDQSRTVIKPLRAWADAWLDRNKDA